MPQLFSKYSDKKFRYPTFKDNSDHLKYIIKLLISKKIDVVIPVRDDSTLFFSKYKKILSKYAKFIVPDFKVLEIANNKKITLAASKVGIDVARVINDVNFKEVNNDSKIISRPVKGSGSRGIVVVDKKSKSTILNLSDENFIAQEYIPHATKINML